MVRFTLYVLAVIVLTVSAKAETRFLVSMPTSDKLTATAARKSKTPIWECRKVKVKAERNSASGVKGATPTWFSKIGESEDAADAALQDGKVAVECKSKQFSKGKMRAADFEEAE